MSALLYLREYMGISFRAMRYRTGIQAKRLKLLEEGRATPSREEWRQLGQGFEMSPQSLRLKVAAFNEPAKLPTVHEIHVLKDEDGACYMAFSDGVRLERQNPNFGCIRTPEGVPLHYDAAIFCAYHVFGTPESLGAFRRTLQRFGITVSVWYHLVLEEPKLHR